MKEYWVLETVETGKETKTRPWLGPYPTKKKAEEAMNSSVLGMDDYENNTLKWNEKGPYWNNGLGKSFQLSVKEVNNERVV